MKITKSQLKSIIKEELASLDEVAMMGGATKTLQQLSQAGSKLQGSLPTSPDPADPAVMEAAQQLVQLAGSVDQAIQVLQSLQPAKPAVQSIDPLTHKLNI